MGSGLLVPENGSDLNVTSFGRAVTMVNLGPDLFDAISATVGVQVNPRVQEQRLKMVDSMSSFFPALYIQRGQEGPAVSALAWIDAPHLLTALTSVLLTLRHVILGTAQSQAARQVPLTFASLQNHDMFRVCLEAFHAMLLFSAMVRHLAPLAVRPVPASLAASGAVPVPALDALELHDVLIGLFLTTPPVERPAFRKDTVPSGKSAVVLMAVCDMPAHAFPVTGAGITVSRVQEQQQQQEEEEQDDDQDPTVALEIEHLGREANRCNEHMGQAANNLLTFLDVPSTTDTASSAVAPQASNLEDAVDSADLAALQRLQQGLSLASSISATITDSDPEPDELLEEPNVSDEDLDNMVYDKVAQTPSAYLNDEPQQQQQQQQQPEQQQPPAPPKSCGAAGCCESSDDTDSRVFSGENTSSDDDGGESNLPDLRDLTELADAVEDVALEDSAVQAIAIAKDVAPVPAINIVAEKDKANDEDSQPTIDLYPTQATAAAPVAATTSSSPDKSHRKRKNSKKNKKKAHRAQAVHVELETTPSVDLYATQLPKGLKRKREEVLADEDDQGEAFLVDIESLDKDECIIVGLPAKKRRAGSFRRRAMTPEWDVDGPLPAQLRGDIYDEVLWRDMARRHMMQPQGRFCGACFVSKKDPKKQRIFCTFCIDAIRMACSNSLAKTKSPLQSSRSRV